MSLKALKVRFFSSFISFNNENNQMETSVMILSEIISVLILLYYHILISTNDPQDTVIYTLSQVIRNYTENSDLNLKYLHLIGCIIYLVYLLVDHFLRMFLTGTSLDNKNQARLRNLFNSSILNREIFMWIFCASAFHLALRSRSELDYGILGNAGSSLLFFSIIFLGLISSLFSALFSNIPFNLDGSFNAKSSILNMINFAFKCISIFTTDYLISLERMAYIVIPLLTIIFSIKLFAIFYYIPLYNYRGLKIVTLFTTTQLMLSFGILFSVFLKWNSNSVLISEIIFYPLIMKISKESVEHFTISALFSRDRRLENKILNQFFGINYFAKSSTLNPHEEQRNICNKNLIYSLGLISNNLENPEESFTNNINQLIEKIYYPGISSNDLVFIKLSFIHRCLLQKSNMLAALRLIISLNKMNLTFKEELIYHQLKQIFQNKFDDIQTEKNPERINIKSVIDFEKASSEICELLSSNTQKYIDFWKLYREQEVQALNLKILSMKIEEEASVILKYMQKFETSYGFFAAKLLPLYYLYLIAIRNAPLTGEKIQKSIGMLILSKIGQASDEEKITNFNLSEKKNVFLYVSNAREKLGKIFFSTGNIYEQLGWNAAEIMGKNIEFLLPFSSHSALVEMMGFEEVNLQPDRIFYCKTKAGFIVPCTVMISLYPYIENELVYVYTIRTWTSPFKTDFLILSRRGKIEAYSKKISRFLEFNKQKSLNFKDFCLGLGNPVGSRINVDSSMNDIVEIGLDTPKKTIEDFSPLLTSVKRETIENINFVTGTSLKFDQSLSLSPIEKLSPEILLRLRTKAAQEKSRISFSNPKGFVKHYSFEVTYEFLGDMKFTCIKLLELKQKSSKKIVKTINESEEFDDLDVPNEMVAETIGKTKRQSVQIIADKPLPYSPAKVFNIEEGFETALDISSDSEISSRVSDTNLQIDHRKRKESLMKKLAEIESQSVASIATKKSLKHKVESAIYSIPAYTSLKAIFGFVFGYIILAMILLIMFQQNTRDKLEKVKANSLILRAASSRIFTLVEINSIGQIIRLLDRGLWKNDRYTDFGMPDLYEAIQAYSETQALTLSRLSNQIRVAISGVESSLQSEFYNEKILIDGPGPNLSKKYGHMLDLDALIIEECLKLYYQPRSALVEDNDQIQFLLNNILNDLIVASEKVLDIFLADNQKKLDLNLKFITDVFIVITILAFVFAVIILLESRKLIISRNNLLEVFLRLDNSKIDEAVKRAEDFLMSIKMKVNLMPREVKKKRRWKKPTFYGTKSDNLSKKRLLNSFGINQNINRSIILLLFWCCLFIFSYFSLFLTTVSSNSNFQTSVERVVQINQFMVNLDMQVWIMEEYIGQNRSTFIRNNPINEEMDKMYSDTVSSQPFFLTLIDLIENAHERDYVKTLILGDLCPLKLDPALPDELCFTIANGAPQSGIIGLISYIMKFIKITKDFYDSSTLTKRDQEIAFAINMGNVAEMTTYMYLFPAYRSLENITFHQFSDQIDSYPSQLFQKLMIIFVVIVCVGTWIWLKIWKRLDRERLEWGRMTRMIPILMFFNHKALRNYISKYRNIKLEPIGFEDSWT